MSSGSASEKLPWILCHQIGESWCRAAYVAPRIAPLGRLNQGAAKATAHVVANMRVQRRSQTHETCVSCTVKHPVHGRWRADKHVHCFLDPSTARLNGEDDQSASLRYGQLWVGCLLDVVLAAT